MRKKGILALALSALIGVCGFSACGGNADSTSDTKKDTQLMDYESYKGERNISITAWDFPTLEYSETLGYNTEKNNQLISDIKNAGFDILNLTGRNSLYINNAENIQLTKEQIALCNANGLKSVVFGSNTTGENENCIFTDNYPDFSECEGFYGFMPWDEPHAPIMNKLAGYARQFNETYKNNPDAVYLVNLLPSYAELFTSGGYSDYLKTYCETVLSEVEGEKWLMVDSYPILENGKLMTNFLYDLMMLKTYALEYDASAHMCLMSTATGNKMRSPTKEELYTQVYTALAFGMDAYSWYTYCTPREVAIPDGSAPVKLDGTKTELYDAVKEVNLTVKSFGHVYKCFEWQGLLLNSDKQTSAMNMITRNTELRDWVMTADETDTLLSVSCDNDYIIGVMKDELGNDGFMVSNYSDMATSADIALDFVFDGANYLRVYKNGEMEDIALTDGEATLSLAYGEGAFIIPYYKG